MTGITLTETIAAPPEAVFARATDYANCAEWIEAITAMEILTDGPVAVGTRFKETRKMWGKEASETMEILELEAPQRVTLGAESHGCRYRTEFRFEPEGQGTKVTMDFQGTPLTFGAKVFTVLMKPMIKSMSKMCAKDLADLKQACEA